VPGRRRSSRGRGVVFAAVCSEVDVQSTGASHVGFDFGRDWEVAGDVALCAVDAGDAVLPRVGARGVADGVRATFRQLLRSSPERPFAVCTPIWRA